MGLVKVFCHHASGVVGSGCHRLITSAMIVAKMGVGSYDDTTRGEGCSSPTNPMIDLLAFLFPSHHERRSEIRVTAPQLRVKHVPDGIAKKVERQDHNGDGNPRENHQGPMRDQDVRDGAAHHVAPGRRRRRNAHPEEAEGSLNDNGHTQFAPWPEPGKRPGIAGRYSAP